jgi:hypothetical protein
MEGDRSPWPPTPPHGRPAGAHGRSLLRRGSRPRPGKSCVGRHRSTAPTDRCGAHAPPSIVPLPTAARGSVQKPQLDARPGLVHVGTPSHWWSIVAVESGFRNLFVCSSRNMPSRGRGSDDPRVRALAHSWRFEMRALPVVETSDLKRGTHSTREDNDEIVQAQFMGRKDRGGILMKSPG